MKNVIKIVGGGLAGSEAALQLAKYGWIVDLYEMRPEKQTPVHETDLFAELVCSNSLKSDLRSTASGLLKEELRLLDCELLKIAESHRLPAGNALAVDRHAFADEVTRILYNNPRIKIHRQEVTNLTDDLTIIATGPLSSDNITLKLQELIGLDNLFFYDAIAPIVSADTIDQNRVYFKGRYDKGGADYLNCPFSREEYENFVNALLSSEKYIGKDFEKQFFTDMKGQSKIPFYENCTPIEELAHRGIDTLRFGVMRPVGLEDPKTGKRPYAVIQLRAENKDRTAFNLVGCQTMMTQSSQRRVFRLIPGLECAVFFRYGSIHRNTYLNAPQILSENLSLRNRENIFIAGQLSGVEGYVESITSGLLVSMIISGRIKNLPESTITGQLWKRMITIDNRPFVPVNANYGLLPPLETLIRDKRKKHEMMAERSITDLKRSLPENLT